MKRYWIKPLARAGYASRGVVYSVIGLFAMLAAIGIDDKKDSRDALREILQQPFGSALLALLIVGLVGFVAWRSLQAVFDTDNHGWSARGIVIRTGLLVSAFTYGILTFYAVSLITVSALVETDGDIAGLLTRSLSALIGVDMVALGLALIFAGTAIAHWWKAATRRYAAHFMASETAMAFIHPISIIGLTARGTVFAVISLLLAHRFWYSEPFDGTPPGTKEVMQYLQQLPLGQGMLMALGIGFVLFAAYSFVETVWRRIEL